MPSDMKIRAKMLGRVLERSIGGHISSIPGQALAEQGAPNIEGTISGVHYMSPDGQMAMAMAIVSGMGEPSFFQVGINLSFCPYILTAQDIQFDSCDGGTVTITRAIQEAVPV